MPTTKAGDGMKKKKPVDAFKEIEPPILLLMHMGRVGSRAIRCFERTTFATHTSVIQSVDPSGPNGEFEEHVSVAVSDWQGRRRATREEIEAALDAVGWTKGEYVVSKGLDTTVHVYLKKDRRSDPQHTKTTGGRETGSHPPIIP
jgi:hypothetical protein